MRNRVDSVLAAVAQVVAEVVVAAAVEGVEVAAGLLHLDPIRATGGKHVDVVIFNRT